MDTLLSNMDTSTAAITWETIKKEVNSDDTSIMLHDWIVKAVRTAYRTFQTM